MGEIFAQQMMALRPRLLTFATSLTRNRVIAEDVVQESIMRAWRAREQLQPGSNMDAWLCTIVRNQYYTHLRKRRHEVADTGDIDYSALVKPAEHESIDGINEILHALSILPIHFRSALLAVGVMGLSTKDAAEFCGVEEGTIKSRMNRGRTVLAERLGITHWGRAKTALSETV